MSVTNYQGYILKAANGVILDQYIAADSYSTTPDQRLDKDSYRDGYGELHRTVLPSVSTTIKFSTLENLTLDEKIVLQTAINSGLIDTQERKTTLTYWNDELDAYKTDIFYIPDVEFPIRFRDKKTIYYGTVNYKFIGYGQSRL